MSDNIYAPLPVPQDFCVDGEDHQYDTFTAEQMHAFADATHALRTRANSVEFDGIKTPAARAEAVQSVAGEWRWVPVEPTQEMLDAVVPEMDGDIFGDKAEAKYREDWAAMLAAAPLPQPQPSAGRMALIRAREMVEEWASYASPYFQEKHDIAGDLAYLDAAIDSAAKEQPNAK